MLLTGEGVAAEAGNESIDVSGVGVGVGGVGGGGGAILEEPQDAGGLEWGGASSSSSSDPGSSFSDSDAPVVRGPRLKPQKKKGPKAKRREKKPSAALAGRIAEEEEEAEEEKGPAPAAPAPSSSSSSSSSEEDELHHSDDDDEEVTGAWPESTSPGAARHRLASHEASGLARLRAAALAANATLPDVVAAAFSNNDKGDDDDDDGSKGTNANNASTDFRNPLASEKWRPGQLNRYGYSPCGLEWDCWIDPQAPSDLGGASVDHGTPGALVTQAVATALPLDGARRSRGEGGRVPQDPEGWDQPCGVADEVREVCECCGVGRPSEAAAAAAEGERRRACRDRVLLPAQRAGDRGAGRALRRDRGSSSSSSSRRRRGE